MATLIIGVFFTLIGLAMVRFASSEEEARGAAAWVKLGVILVFLRAFVFLGERVGW